MRDGEAVLPRESTMVLVAASSGGRGNQDCSTADRADPTGTTHAMQGIHSKPSTGHRVAMRGLPARHIQPASELFTCGCATMLLEHRTGKYLSSSVLMAQEARRTNTQNNGRISEKTTGNRHKLTAALEILLASSRRGASPSSLLPAGLSTTQGGVTHGDGS